MKGPQLQSKKRRKVSFPPDASDTTDSGKGFTIPQWEDEEFGIDRTAATLERLFGKKRTEPQDDCVEYCLYPDIITYNTHAKLQDLIALILSFVSQWTNGYIWQKDSFDLSIHHDRETGMPYLKGRTRFGDCIDDEWFIVFLVREVTKEFKSLIGSVMDNDGQFLLIEAAHVLPDWLDPSNADNRVYISQGHLHIIPLPQTPADHTILPTGRQLTVTKALAVIRSYPEKTRVCSTIETQALEKCAEYPDLVVQGRYLHRAKCVVPRDIARILKADPGLISAAVEAFYHRDPLLLKACQKMTRFPPSTSVETTIKFTKSLYAQTISQEFFPPKPFRLPLPTEPNYKASELGMKVACGFEMLANDVHLQDLLQLGIGKAPETYHFDADPGWRSFKERLVNVGYFKNELEGSKLYKSLELTAKEQYLASLSKSIVENGDMDEEESGERPWRNPLQRLQNALASAPDGVDGEIICDEPEDSDEWMNIDFEEFERQLAMAGKGMELSPEDLDEPGVQGDSDDDDDLLSDSDLEDLKADKHAMPNAVEKKESKKLQKVVEGFRSFVNTDSGLGGALFPGENDLDVKSDDDDLAESDDDSVDLNALIDEDENRPVQLDANSFLESMMKALGIDNTILRPISDAKPIKKDSKRKPSEVPRAPPSDFDPTALLKPKSHTLPKVTWDSDEEETDEKSYKVDHRGKVAVINGREVLVGSKGLQEDEEDSDEEKQMDEEWDEMFIRLQGVADKMKEGLSAESGLEKKGKISVQLQENEEDSDDESDIDMKLDAYMEAMDRELDKTKIGQDFERVSEGNRLGEGEGMGKDEGEEDDMQPVDVDVNLVKNLLDSFSAQQGLPGPASNILGRLGLVLPKDIEE
ncbi:hypothetical protein HDV05_003380 [Chytridiales sp. JEL 0842]|nr:hypothetical protein HDV05_003380 [Chytridiales sp. JEL 0842]